jgi:hypothetical protein
MTLLSAASAAGASEWDEGADLIDGGTLRRLGDALRALPTHLDASLSRRTLVGSGGVGEAPLLGVAQGEALGVPVPEAPPLAEDEASTWTTTAARLRGASTSRGDAEEPPTTFVTFLWPKCDDMSTFAVAPGQRVARPEQGKPAQTLSGLASLTACEFMWTSASFDGYPYVCYTSQL